MGHLSRTETRGCASREGTDMRGSLGQKKQSTAHVGTLGGLRHSYSFAKLPLWCPQMYVIVYYFYLPLSGFCTLLPSPACPLPLLSPPTLVCLLTTFLLLINQGKKKRSCSCQLWCRVVVEVQNPRLFQHLLLVLRCPVA